MIVYVAGPYRGNVSENIARAKGVAQALWVAGHAAICPHLNTAYFDDDLDLPDDAYLTGDLAILARCDAIVMTPNWSQSEGAKEEYRFAVERNIPIYIWPDIPPANQTEQKNPEQAAGFIDVVMKMYRTHLSKNADYSPANILMTGELGLATRLWDKTARLANLLGVKIKIKSSAYLPKQEMDNNFSLVAQMVHSTLALLAMVGFQAEIEPFEFTGQVSPKNESITDTLEDQAVYSVIGLLLREEKWGR